MTRFVPEWLRWPEVRELVVAFAGNPLRFVGGAVRDALLGRPVKDIDAATPLPPKDVMALLRQGGIRALPTGIEHGTVTAVMGQRHIEITTLRRDVETDGRHATVAYTDNWREDAARRDFTLNALYLSPDGQLFDYFGGAQDALDGQVVFIGNAKARIREDYLRILRFFRFFAWYGKGTPDAEAVAACTSLAKHVESLSGERVQGEMLKLIEAPGCKTTLAIMRHSGVLPHVLGFDVSDVGVFSRFEEVESVSDLLLVPAMRLVGFVLKAGALITEEEALEILVKRLRLPNRVATSLGIVHKAQKSIQPRLTEAEQKRLLRRLGKTHFQIAVLTRWAAGREPITANHPYAEMLKLAQTWQPPVFPLTGDDLIKRGLKPGKAMGEILKSLEEEWEESGYQLTKKELLGRISTN